MEVPFSDLIIYIYPVALPFLLVLFRVLGLFVFVPVFSNASIPGNVKVLLGLAITVCVWNVVPHGGVSIPTGMVGLSIAVLGEMSVGMLIGLLTALLLMGVQLGGHMISQQMGLSMAAVYDPMFDQQSTVIEQLAFWLASLVFFAMGGHRELINAVVRSYDTVPLGTGLDPAMMLNVTLGALGTAFTIGIKVAAPALVVFFLATVTSGFIGKSMPQINIMSIGLGMNLLIGMMMIFFSIAGWALVSTQAWNDFFVSLGRVFGK